MKTEIKVDGLMVLTLAAVGAGLYLYSKRGALVAAVNPASHDNLAYRGAVALSESVGVTGGHGGHSYDDHFFAAVDLLNPFNESDNYAKQVWGF